MQAMFRIYEVTNNNLVGRCCWIYDVECVKNLLDDALTLPAITDVLHTNDLALYILDILYVNSYASRALPIIIVIDKIALLYSRKRISILFVAHIWDPNSRKLYKGLVIMLNCDIPLNCCKLICINRITCFQRPILHLVQYFSPGSIISSRRAVNCIVEYSALWNDTANVGASFTQCFTVTVPKSEQD